MSARESNYVNITGGAIGAGFGIEQLVGLILTNSKNNAIQRSFANLQDVQDIYGADSPEAKAAAIYFAGRVGANARPGKLFIWPYDKTDFKEGDATPYTAMLDNAASNLPTFHGITFLDNLTLAEKQAVAQWNGNHPDRYWMVLWDNDTTATTQGSEGNTSFGNWLQKQQLEGITVAYNNPETACFLLSLMASQDYTQSDGVTNFMYRKAPGVGAAVTDDVTRQNLIDNGYTFIVEAGNGSQRFVFLDECHVSGQFQWANDYVNALWLIYQMKIDFMNLLLTVSDIPYNSKGDALVYGAVSDTIRQAIDFGIIQSGITLSDEERQQAIQVLGNGSDRALYRKGFVFIPAASTTPPSQRDKRGAPPSKFWYTQGESIQKIVMTTEGVR